MDKNTLSIELKSQMRVQGGNNYIKFVDELLHVRLNQGVVFSSSDYEVVLFESISDLYTELQEKENSNGLCRLVAGYSWPWLSKNNPKAIDIEIEDMAFQWNQTDKDWINSPNAFNEVGCIHTTQGYDLNYTGVIFGREINYNSETGNIEIDPKLYFDINGKKGVKDVSDLKAYVINIYKTIMYRGIKGTYIYACNPELREYLRQHITVYKKGLPFRVIPFDQVKPFVNAVPLIDISAAAGNFSDLQIHSEIEWIELPMNVSVREGYFVCKVVGESMNRKIPNGSYCLFKQDEGGSRNGKIVLVECSSINDSEFGSGYTVKEYHSKKIVSEEGWSHQSITLKPLSNNTGYNEIQIEESDLDTFRVRGVFECVL